MRGRAVERVRGGQAPPEALHGRAVRADERPHALGHVRAGDLPDEIEVCEVALDDVRIRVDHRVIELRAHLTPRTARKSRQGVSPTVTGAGGATRSRNLCTTNALVEADDLDPVRALAGRILLQQPERAARLVDRVDRDRVGFLAARDQEPALRIDREAARLLLGRRAADVGELAGRAVDAERAERAARPLRDVEELAVRRQVEVGRPDIVVGVARRRRRRADGAARRAGPELLSGRQPGRRARLR